MTVALQVLILLTLGHTVSSWDNDWDQPLLRQCLCGQAVSRIQSYHDNGREDRRWTVSCKQAAVSSTCQWSGFVNNFDQVINYNCPTNHAIAGMQSYHSNHHEDRRWKYLCCATTQATSDCHETHYVNRMDERLFWSVPRGYLMTGVSSYHDNGTEDRRWRFRYCRG